MKMLITTALLQLVSISVFTQTPISNTKWNARITIPRVIDVGLEFARDTFFISRLNGRLAEASYFSQRNDSLLIRKLTGVSPCSPGYEAWYKIEWIENGEKFLLHNLTDTCQPRANSWVSIRIDGKIKQND